MDHHTNHTLTGAVLALGLIGGHGLLSGAPADRTERVIERGPHHAVVETTRTELDKAGKPVVRQGRYTILRNGMHYQEDGQWLESRELIEPAPGGAVARYGPHKVIFKNNLNVAEGGG